MQGSASQTVANQVKTGEDVLSALTTHKQTVTEALHEGQKGPDAKKLTMDEFVRWFDWLESELHAANTRLWSREMDYTAEQGDDHAPADERRTTGEVLDDYLRTSRNSAEQICGRSKLGSYGMATLPSGGIDALAKYAENAVKMLRDNPAPVTKVGLTFDPPTVADQIDGALGSYMAAVSSDKTEQRELENTKGLRDQASDEWKVTYLSVAHQLEGLFRQAQRPDLAERVRPTNRRMRGEEGPLVDVDEDVDTPEPAEPVEPVEPAEPVADGA